MPHLGEPNPYPDHSALEHDMIVRPRPYHYDLSLANAGAINVAAGVGVNTWGAYTQLIPVNTYDFGDSPNRIQVRAIVFEDISANDTYIIELYKYNGVTYTPIGAIRFVRLNPFTRSFEVYRPCRPLNNDVMSLQTRLKSAIGGNNVDISISVARYTPTFICPPLSAGVFPFG